MPNAVQHMNQTEPLAPQEQKHAMRLSLAAMLGLKKQGIDVPITINVSTHNTIKMPSKDISEEKPSLSYMKK